MEAGLTAAAEPAAPAGEPDPVGRQVGRYELMAKLGEGGFGVVYRARQVEPIKREVAVKILKPGMNSREVVKRFNLEREALAIMEHPCIAGVHDAGTTEAGSPYFVMDLIRGTPLTAFCDAEQLTINERLQLFERLCGAVQHAHHKGIIHRDLKPSNILVSWGAEGRPEPVVIDFGVAKAIGINFADQTFHTLLGRLMGTPQYMSPEQAALQATDVDTRSDVYSLGVILYELLAGTPPFDGKRLAAAGFDEMRRVIREQVPSKPSSRVLESQGDKGEPIARCRKLEDPGRLARLLQGDLDWIVMKALEKDRNRRYDTCSALAQDVRCYLEQLPVSAGPPGAGYRIGRFATRHRGPAIAAGLIFFAVISGAVTSLVLYYKQKEAQKQAQIARWNSLLDSARAYRTGGANIPDRRSKALRALAEAAALPLGEEGKEDRATQLRDEMIACLAWVDATPRTLMKGMDSSRRVAAIDPGYRWLAVSPRDDVLEILSLPEAKRLAVLPTTKLARVAFSSDGSKVLLAEQAGDLWKLALWKWGVGERTECGSCVAGACDLAPDGNSIAAVSADRELQFKDLSGTATRASMPLPAATKCLRWDGSGSRVAVAYEAEAGTSEPGVDVLEVSTGARTQIRTELVTALGWSPDGRQLAMGKLSGAVALAALPDRAGGEVVTLLGLTHGNHEDAVESIAWSPDGRMIASGGTDGKVYLWDGRQEFALCRNPGWAGSLSFSPESRAVGPIIWEGTLRDLRVEHSNVCRRAKGHPGVRRLEAGAWNDNGTLMVTTAADGVRLWNRLGEELAVLRDVIEPAGVVFAKVSAGRDALLIAGREGVVRRDVVMARDGEKLRGRILPPTAVGPRVPSGMLSIALDGREAVLIAATSNGLNLLPLTEGVSSQLPVGGWADSVSVSPNGQFVAASLQGGGDVSVWRRHDGKLQARLPIAGPARVAFSHDGRWLMTGDSRMYRVWKNGSWDEIPSMRLENQMGDHPGRMVFSPRDTAVVISRKVRELVVLRSDTLRVLAQPSFEQQWPLCISGDGMIMATEAPGGRVCLWDLAAIRKQLKSGGLDWADLRDLPALDIPTVSSLAEEAP